MRCLWAHFSRILFFLSLFVVASSIVVVFSSSSLSLAHQKLISSGVTKLGHGMVCLAPCTSFVFTNKWVGFVSFPPPPLFRMAPVVLWLSSLGVST